MMCTPLFKIIKERYPDSHLGFLCYDMGKPIVENNPYLDIVHYIPARGRPTKEFRLLREIRNENYNYTVSFWNTNRSAIYSLLSGSRTRLSTDRKRQIFYTKITKNIRNGLPPYSAYDKLKLFDPNLADQNPSLNLYLNLPISFPMIAFLQEKGLNPKRPVVIISPTHRRGERKWPIKKYSQLADLLVENWNTTVFWAYGPGEEQVASHGVRLTKGKSFKIPGLDWQELAAFIAQCDLFIGNSNGPSHLAVAVNTPSIQIHGPTFASAWSPLNSLHQAIEIPAEEKRQTGIASIATAKVWSHVQNMKSLVFKKAEKRMGNMEIKH